MIACGKYHTLFLVDGSVYASGHNREGQIGNNSNENAYKPVKLGVKEAVWVSAWHSSACLTARGKVYIWGLSNCKTPTKIAKQEFKSVRVGGNFTLLSDMEGHIMQTTNGSQPHYVQGIEEH